MNRGHIPGTDQEWRECHSRSADKGLEFVPK